jgi:polyisoprenoid-binding protein YceI
MSATQQQATGVWTIDKAHSTARFEVEHNSASTFRGSFRDIDARLEYGENGAVVTGTVKVDSIDLGDEQMRGHVLSPEFFDAERYPTLDFVSRSIAYENNEATIEGDLTIRGASHPVTVHGTIGEPFENAAGSHSLAVRLAATLDRTEYGLNWQMQLPSGDPVLGNEVRLAVELELVEA